jgi:hypothetical protein
VGTLCGVPVKDLAMLGNTDCEAFKEPDFDQ